MNLFGYHIKRKKAPGIPYNIIAASQRAPQPNHWQVMLPFCFNLITAMFFPLTIVMYKG